MKDIGPTFFLLYPPFNASPFYCLLGFYATVFSFVAIADIVMMEAELRFVLSVDDFIVVFDFMLDFMNELSRFYLLEFKVTLNLVLLAKPR